MKSDPEEALYMVAGVHDEYFHTDPMGLPLADKRRCVPQVSHSYAKENTPATIEADQILLAFQLLASNSITAKFNKNINRNSKLRQPLTTKKPIFNGHSEKFELTENLFPTNHTMHNQLTEEDKKNYFHSLMRGDVDAHRR